MILGIGTDIVAIHRIQKMYERHGERVAQKFLAPEELATLAISNDPGRLLAKRFAAKEAFAKAVGTGLREPVLLPHIAITHDALGKPGLSFAPELQDWLKTKFGHIQCHLSLSDEKETVVAFVVIETAP